MLESTSGAGSPEANSESKTTASHGFHLPPRDSSLPATPLFNTHAFESAYRLPNSLTYSSVAFNTLNSLHSGICSESPTTSSDHWTQFTSSPPARGFMSRSSFTPGETDSSTLLDMSLLTDTSSMLDESLPVGSFLLSTPPLEHMQPNIHTQTPRSGSGLLLGLGVEGLVQNNGKVFDGMGLLSERFARFESAVGDETVEESDDDQDTSPWKRFLHEVLLTFSRDDALSESHSDTLLSPVMSATTITSSRSVSGANGSDGMRGSSVATISSQMKCLPRVEKTVQKGRCAAGPTWRP